MDASFPLIHQSLSTGVCMYVCTIMCSEQHFFDAAVINTKDSHVEIINFIFILKADVDAHTLVRQNYN